MVVVEVSDSLHILTIYILKVVVVVEVSDLTSLVIRGSSHNIYIYLVSCGSGRGLRFTAYSHNIYILKVVVVVEVSDLTSLVIRGSSHNIYIYLVSCGSGRGLRFTACSHIIYLESCGSGRGLRFNIPSHKRQFSQYIYIS